MAKGNSIGVAWFACWLAASASAAETLPLTTFRNLAEGKRQTVVVYGTSLTAGGGWTKDLRRWFDERYPGQVTFVNSGGSGQHSGWGRSQVKAKVLDHRPDLVIVEFSYNDAHLKFKFEERDAAENLAAIVGAIREQNGTTDVVLQTMNVPWDPPGGKGPAENRPKLEAFNDLYRQYAQRHDLPLVDHYVEWKRLLESDPEKYRRWLPDGSHPTDEASRAVTWAGLRALFERAERAAKAGGG